MVIQLCIKTKMQSQSTHPDRESRCNTSAQLEQWESFAESEEEYSDGTVDVDIRLEMNTSRILSDRGIYPLHIDTNFEAVNATTTIVSKEQRFQVRRRMADQSPPPPGKRRRKI